MRFVLCVISLLSTVYGKCDTFGDDNCVSIQLEPTSTDDSNSTDDSKSFRSRSTSVASVRSSSGESRKMLGLSYLVGGVMLFV